MSYKDKTFCSNADNCAKRKTCHRWFSPEEAEKALKWWGKVGGWGTVSISMAPFTECFERESKHD